ncbi:Protein of unknown function [Pyronema omphalodes CBS 100304]|uniref:Uncharacterized protein n=1 Tax=Pyronema omphalodes (strain CBS 100304) TaxID=1076935 RepID=U4LUJ2_PYROM|nr:Protein of unknown function [Pyronema omphalodes CBS 100304]
MPAPGLLDFRCLNHRSRWYILYICTFYFGTTYWHIELHIIPKASSRFFNMQGDRDHRVRQFDALRFALCLRAVSPSCFACFLNHPMC